MRYATYLRWGVITGLFATLFVPFLIADGALIANMFFPYITGKNFVFRIIVEITAVFYIILALREPKYRPRASWLMWAVIAFVGWMAVATLTSVDPIKSFWSNFERMEGYVGLLHLFAFFVIAGAVLNVEKLWDRFFNTSIGASLVMGVYALMQGLQLFGLHPSSQSGARADATFGNATYLAVYMLFNIFLTLFMLARGRIRTGMQIFYGLALAFQVTGLYFTQTRGALLGAVGGLIVAAIWIAWRAKRAEHTRLRRAALGGLVATVVVAGAFVAFREPLKDMGGTIGRLASISFEEKTTRSRLFSIWPMALQGAAERPVTGWGQENFSYVFNAHYTPDMWDQEQWFDRAHNQFLDWMIAGGFLAFLLYASFFGLAAWAIIRSEFGVPQQAVLLGLLAGYAFNNLFVFDNLMSSVYFFVLLAFAHGLSANPLPGRMWLSRPVGDRGVAVAAPLVAIVIVLAGWTLNAPGMARAKMLVRTLASAQDPAASIEGFKQTLGPVLWPGTPLGQQEVAEQLMTYAGNSVAGSQASDALKQDFYATAVGAAQALMERRKNDARLELFLSGLYGQFGQYAEALAHAKRAAELSPNKQQILFQLGLAEINAKEEKDALDTFKKAYELAPENDQALIYFAAGEYFVGRRAAGDKLLTERFGSPVVDNPQLLQIYTNLKMHDRVVAIWQMRANKNPEDFNVNLGLAGAYYAAGNMSATVEQLKKLQQLDPAKAGQIQSLIDQIQSGILRLQ